MTTSPNDMDQPNIIDKPLATCPGSVSTLPYPDAIIEEAFEDINDKMCCVCQIAAITKMPIGLVMDHMDACEDAIYGTDVWKENGVTWKMIFGLARRNDRGACMLHNGTAIEIVPGTQAPVFNVHESHA